MREPPVRSGQTSKSKFASFTKAIHDDALNARREPRVLRRSRDSVVGQFNHWGNTVARWRLGVLRENLDNWRRELRYVSPTKPDCCFPRLSYLSPSSRCIPPTGGTAIQDNLVLTAAHCVYKSGREDCPDGDTAWGNNPVWSGHCAADPSEIWIAKNNVRFNASAKNEAVPDYNFPAVLEGSEFVQGGVLDYIVHPDYQDGSVDWPFRGNDLAIIILDSSSPMPGPYVKLARSPPKAEAKGTIVGMGANNYYRQWVEGQSRTYFPPRLYQVDVTVGKPGVAPCVDGPRHMHPGRAPASLFIARVNRSIGAPSLPPRRCLTNRCLARQPM